VCVCVRACVCARVRACVLSGEFQTEVDWRLRVVNQDRQISVVRELLNDKNRTLLDDKDRERLAFLSTDVVPSSPCDAYARSPFFSHSLCSIYLSTQHPFNGPFLQDYPGKPVLIGKPIWILLKQETVSGSGISWATCKSAPRSRQITVPAPRHSVFYRPDALPAAQPTESKH